MIKDSSASFMEDVCLMVWYAMSKKHTLNHGGLTSEFPYLAIGKKHRYSMQHFLLITTKNFLVLELRNRHSVSLVLEIRTINLLENVCLTKP